MSRWLLNSCRGQHWPLRGTSILDLCLTGTIQVNGQRIEPGSGPAPDHPLAARAWPRLEPGLPRSPQEAFYKDVCPLLDLIEQTRDYLIDAGVWRVGAPSLVHLTLRKITDLDPGSRMTPLGSSTDPTRAAALRALASMTTITVPPGLESIAASVPGAAEVNTILDATRYMITMRHLNSAPNPTGFVFGAQF